MTEEDRDPLQILILNWRDLRHPRAGGAELLTHEHARRLVERGHSVTLFAAAVDGAPREEEVDGVRVIRGGGTVTTRLNAWRWYRRLRGQGARFDVVVEEINTLPYLASRWSGVPTVLYLNQLAREVWWYEAPKPLAPLGLLLESVHLRLNRRLPAIVISESTRRDLVEAGFRAEEVVVVPIAIDPPVRIPPVDKEPGLLVYVGRLTPSKRIDHLVEALAGVRDGGVDARLEVVGRGSETVRQKLEDLARKLGVAEHVRFRGYLDAEGKQELLARAALLVIASAREGWGLVVTEANALGTPAVVYDRPGLRDSTAHEETGLVTAPDPASLAAGIRRALTEPGLYERLRAGALASSGKFTWERSTASFERVLVDVAERAPAPARAGRSARSAPDA